MHRHGLWCLAQTCWRSSACEYLRFCVCRCVGLLYAKSVPGFAREDRGNLCAQKSEDLKQPVGDNLRGRAEAFRNCFVANLAQNSLATFLGVTTSSVSNRQRAWSGRGNLFHRAA